ncbi:hypothetical protein CAC42_5476 [Sphaceloma murrayae]|uniref:Aspartate kinase n=1 Tax=Sphaceloma murrayae TaxID=2082308 RepID=A0A2K1QJG7_9PEZI|nr:hypothetical protein CAC42_5476 [Sphaceloma murrayae]
MTHGAEHDVSSQTPVTSTSAMIAGMTPFLHQDRCVYATFKRPIDSGLLIEILDISNAIFNEGKDGLSILLPLEKLGALSDHLSMVEPIMRHIELQVYSSLEGVGLTAAIANALTAINLPCNVVAALKHDHIYVPEDRADEAMMALHRLVEEAKRKQSSAT